MEREQFREQEIASRKVGIDPGAAERRAALARQATAYGRAVETYQAEATPLEERVREIRLERPRIERKVFDPGQAIAARQARRELEEQGFTEEQIETPYGELGGTARTGFLPPNVVGGAAVAPEPVPEPVMVGPPILGEPEPVARATPEGIDVKIDSTAKKILLLAFLAKIVEGVKRD